MVLEVLEEGNNMANNVCLMFLANMIMKKMTGRNRIIKSNNLIKCTKHS